MSVYVTTYRSRVGAPCSCPALACSHRRGFIWPPLAVPSATSRATTRASRATTATPAPDQDYLAQGRVVESATRTGIGGLLISVYHVDDAVSDASRLDAVLPHARRLASGATYDGSGEFSVRFVASGIPAAPRSGQPRLNLLLVVEAPDDERSGASARVLYVSNPPRHNAAHVEHFSISLSTEHLQKFNLGYAANSKEDIASYRRERLRDRELEQGVMEFHRSDVERDTAARAKLRRELLAVLATDPSVATLTGEIVGENDTIDSKVQKVAAKAISTANMLINESAGVPVTLYLTPEDRSRLDTYFQSATGGVAKIPEKEIRPLLFRDGDADDPGTLLIHQNPIAKFCAEETFEEVCAREHTGLNGAHHDHESPEPGDAGEPSEGATALTDQALQRHLAALLNGAPSPDDVLLPALGKHRPDRSTVDASVSEFSLRKGPAETPAVYPFLTLHIAFDHVWKILIDENLVNAGYTIDRKFQEKTGVALSGKFSRNWADLITADMLYGAIPQEVPAEVATQFDITLEEWTDLSASHRSKLLEIARALVTSCEGKVRVHIAAVGVVEVPGSRLGTLACERKRQDLREQGERLIDLVRHDDYYTLHKTLRDLHDRVHSKYEFTVFAADNNTHAVNFGLLNEYNLQMAPINYQAGKLVKTIPLSPKEERKYSLKVTRSLKQVRKEAVKNNSSLTHEQTSTSRVEAEIMQKAQSKTNFGLSTEGTYDIFISKGKSTTTFGVEAQQESSKSRKDFRESVMKAVQEYKEERAVEIDTEETEGSEYSESGVIVNPNDELSVTYLFYELQRRFRVSEQLHRVLPVVLVAQEVPAPHQITESWVIANDWIINRALLDDSFRATLTYLANKSVGDDFALRELRRNLRQQRNLVESLRIELSIASHESENRYRALESAIEKRIGEEAAEETDGWFENVGEFFGGGGESPEAAKARELAARDAHQFAVERTEKAEVALRQEMGALHALTLEYNHALRNHLDSETRVKRLLVHLRNNIFHYMQAIWSMEPPDQRFLRLHKVQVPVLELAQIPDPTAGGVMPDRHYYVQVTSVEDIFASFRAEGTTKHRAFMAGTMQPITRFKPLVEVADLDNLLGFKGNYMIFPLKEHNALTEFMAAPYVDSAFGAMDPDDLSNVNLHDYGKYVCCLS